MNERGCFVVLIAAIGLLVGGPVLMLMAQNGEAHENALFLMGCGGMLLLPAFLLLLALPSQAELRRRDIENARHERELRRIRRDD